MPEASAELVGTGAVNVSEWPLYIPADAEAGKASPFVEPDEV
jgi:hypothetical protein